MLSFFVLTIVIEYVIIASFSSAGLIDKYMLTHTFGTNITLSISPLYHMIPIGIILVLVANWVYLTKYVAVVPRRIGPSKKPYVMPKSRFQKSKSKRFKLIRHLLRSLNKGYEKINRSLDAFSNRISSAFLRIRGVSYITQRLSFARAAVKSSITVLAVFMVSAFGLYLLIQPTAIYDAIVGFYEGNPSWPWTIRGIIDGIAASPIGGLTTGGENALAGVAIWFWNTFEGAGKLTESIVNLDLIWKYVICQNIAAWLSTFVIWAYSKYSSQLYRRKGR